MGLLTAGIRALAVPVGRAAGSVVPIHMDGAAITQAWPPKSYDRMAREGYGRNEVVYACVENLATSAAEPRFVAFTGAGKNSKPLETHAAIDLIEKPNPFMGRYELIALTMIYRAIAGNAYIEKVRSAAGKVVQLWPLRPDRMFVIPDRDRFIGGWEYRIGAEVYRLPPEDVIHWKMRNPLDDFYGMPPMAVCAGRVDLDNWMRDFVSAFFRNAGVPSGLLNLVRTVKPGERELIQNRWRQDYGGPTGWHNLLVLDGGEAKYTPMGLPLGERGLILPEIDQMDEARICMVFQTPPSIIGTRLGHGSSSYANRVSDQRMFWELTMTPTYQDLSGALTRGLLPDFGGMDYIGPNFDTVKALQDDVDKLHERVRADLVAGLITLEEAYKYAQYGETLPATGTRFIPTSVVPQPVDEVGLPLEERTPPALLPGATDNPDSTPPNTANPDQAPQGKKPAGPPPMTPPEDSTRRTGNAGSAKDGSY